MGLQYVSGAKTALLFNLSPFFTALLCYFVFNERMTIKKWIGLIIGFLGFIPVLSSQSAGAESLMATLGVLSWGEISIMTAVFSACIGWICMSKLTLEYGYSYMFVNSIGMFMGGLLALPTSYVLESWPSASYLEGNVIFWPLSPENKKPAGTKRQKWAESGSVGYRTIPGCIGRQIRIRW